MKNNYKLLGIISIFLFSVHSTAQTAFEKICKEKVANTLATTIVGEDGWLFLASELSHISKGKFYGKEAAKTAVSTNPSRQDPIPAIVDFNNQLKAQGIQLYLVPVPPKAIVNANKIDASVTKNQNVSIHYKNLYKELSKQGVEVINLFPAFVKETEKGNPTYCKQDSHWNPKGIEVASKAVAGKIKNQDWYTKYSGTKQQEKATKKTIQIDGDLKAGAANASLGKEKIVINSFQKSSKIDTNSPVLIIGDSHTLIFHAGGDMLAKNAGFSDNLAAQLGLNVDLIGVKGSGTSSVRIDLYRKAKNKDWLGKKKVIIWCFAARDFSESKNGWRKVPVVK
ncbi:alginate O-acetyltransferase AlgX-related protein [Kordia sp.]|uniref:alginate O-acetyltransferase AlgX-related protein n=1 Tax=Kordia sp. TaxID=1965332 RepID=UPI003B5BF6D5